MEAVRHTFWLLQKDVRVELRARELILATGLFAAVIVLVFAFCLASGVKPTMEVVAGMLWSATALAAIVGVGRAFEREREHDTLRGLLLLPVSRTAIYVSKVLGIWLLIAFVQAVVTLLQILFFNVSLTLSMTGALVGMQLLGGLGVSTIAALFGAALGRARSREVLLPLVTYPLSVPVLIAGARGTASLLVGEPIGLWVRLLAVLALVFGALGLWLFELLVGGES